jgi:TonB-dependent receptor
VDALKEWYAMNWNGGDGANSQYNGNGVARLTNYSLTERVSSAFLMNTLNIGQSVTLIAGVRVEQEKDEYTGAILYGGVSNIGFIVNAIPDAAGRGIEDSTAQHTEATWLPNVQLAIRPTDFLTVRAAAYRALARPDYNLRLPRFYKYGNSFVFGNTELKNVKAWNYEVNTQMHSNTFGLISVSAFYKVIDDLFHVVTVFPLSGGVADSLAPLPFSTFMNEVGSTWQNTQPFKDILNIKQNSPLVAVSIPYSAPGHSYAWGFEFEHQMNFSSLPVSFLKNITLTYNISVTRSETNLYTAVKGNKIYAASPHPSPRQGSLPIWAKADGVQYYMMVKRQSENQPNFYGNAALGYDIGGFSARVSVFYQDEYVTSYPGRAGDDVTYEDSFTKWDLTLKEKVSPYISLYLNINNFTNVEETKSKKNGAYGWIRPSTAELYGATADFGVAVSL